MEEVGHRPTHAPNFTGYALASAALAAFARLAKVLLGRKLIESGSRTGSRVCSDAKKAIEAAMRRFPTLTEEGFRSPHDTEFAKLRESLTKVGDEFWAANMVI